jgi:hypothetical protein
MGGNCVAAGQMIARGGGEVVVGACGAPIRRTTTFTRRRGSDGLGVSFGCYSGAPRENRQLLGAEWKRAVPLFCG